MDIIDKTEMKANFKHWLTLWPDLKDPDPTNQSVLKSIHTTHTFAFEENWKTGKRFPYRDILFEDKALLSQSYRERENKYDKNEPKQNLGDASEFDFFIFSYLGIHDHFYSLDRKRIAVPAFGIFIPYDLDTEKYTNATRRDLSSPESISDKSKEFFIPTEARQYTSYQISNDERHKSDFWHYWGALDYIRNETNYSKKNWEWKIEFHHFEKVYIKQVKAVLWPVRRVEVSRNFSIINQKNLAEIKSFQREYPDIRVYVYNWNLDRAKERFSHASNIISEYYYENLIYPELDFFSKQFSLEFPDHDH